MNVNKKIISIILGLNITLFAAPMYAFAGWPKDSVVVENEDAVALLPGETFSRIDGNMVYKIECQSQIEKITLKDPSSPTGVADWWRSTVILRGYYHSKKGTPVITHSAKCSFLSNGHVVKLDPMCQAEHEEKSFDPNKWKVTGWHSVHSSATQKVVTLQLNAWHAHKGVFSTQFENMDNSHVNIECTVNGDIKVYFLPNKFFRE